LAAFNTVAARYCFSGSDFVLGHQSAAALYIRTEDGSQFAYKTFIDHGITFWQGFKLRSLACGTLKELPGQMRFRIRFCRLRTGTRTSGIG
jgi:hypothetical protein